MELNILQAQVIAKKMTIDLQPSQKIYFDLVGSIASMKCYFLDPHLGFFMEEGGNGTFLVNDFAFEMDLHVENLEVKSTVKIKE